jgi:hypothetical protein
VIVHSSRARLLVLLIELLQDVLAADFLIVTTLSVTLVLIASAVAVCLPISSVVLMDGSLCIRAL